MQKRLLILLEDHIEQLSKIRNRLTPVGGGGRDIQLLQYPMGDRIVILQKQNHSKIGQKSDIN